MTLSADDIYALLPAVYRTRDADNGSPLRALVGVIAEQVGVLQDDLRGLYADQFIETCAPWVVPYIGDLIGWNGLFTNIPGTSGNRADVADTIGLRRRKGTVIALDQSGHDVTGRPVHIVEFFQRLAVDQSFRHLRPAQESFVDVRRGDRLDRIGTAFDTLNRTVDVRRIAPRTRDEITPDTAPLDIGLHGPGRFGIPDIGAYVWRWNSYPVTGQPAYRVDTRRFMFSPLGVDMELFNNPPPREAFSHLTTRMDVPQPIGRREFHDNPSAFYGPNLSINIVADGKPVALPEICVCNLEDVSATAWQGSNAGNVAIDPVLGRIAFGAGLSPPTNVTVQYCYGFPRDIGGGPYDRSTVLALNRETVTWQQIVGAGATDTFGKALTLAEAVAAFNARPAGTVGLIVLANFDVADIDLTETAAIAVPPGSSLWIVAAQIHTANNVQTWSPNTSRAVLRGNIEIVGTVGTSASASAAAPPAMGQVMLSGIVVAGAVSVTGQPLIVSLQDCTLVPGIGLTRTLVSVSHGAPSLVASVPGTEVMIDRSITGPIWADGDVSVRITDSIVDATADWRVAYAGANGTDEGGALHIEDSTVIGKLRTRLMSLASNTIFLARRPAHDAWDFAVWSTRLQSGCVRFSWVPNDCATPGHYRCLPDTANDEDALRPQFVTLHYGRASYGLLSGWCPIAVWQGADDESQIGVYHALYETQAVGNLRTRLDEFLPFGMEAGIFLVPSAPEVIRLPIQTYGYGRPLNLLDDDADLGFIIGAALI
jgi:hypothetical protein